MRGARPTHAKNWNEMNFRPVHSTHTYVKIACGAPASRRPSPFRLSMVGSGMAVACSRQRVRTPHAASCRPQQIRNEHEPIHKRIRIKSNEHQPSQAAGAPAQAAATLFGGGGVRCVKRGRERGGEGAGCPCPPSSPRLVPLRRPPVHIASSVAPLSKRTQTKAAAALPQGCTHCKGAPQQGLNRKP